MGSFMSHCGSNDDATGQQLPLSSRSMPRDSVITKPTDVEQGIHIQYDENTGTITGVPRQWKDAFPKTMRVETATTRGLPRNLTPTPVSNEPLRLPENDSKASAISKPYNVHHNDVLLKRNEKNELTALSLSKDSSTSRLPHRRQQSTGSATSVPSSYSEQTTSALTSKSHRRQHSIDSSKSASRHQVFTSNSTFANVISNNRINSNHHHNNPDSSANGSQSKNIPGPNGPSLSSLIQHRSSNQNISSTLSTTQQQESYDNRSKHSKSKNDAPQRSQIDTIESMHSSVSQLLQSAKSKRSQNDIPSKNTAQDVTVQSSVNQTTHSSRSRALNDNRNVHPTTLSDSTNKSAIPSHQSIPPLPPLPLQHHHSLPKPKTISSSENLTSRTSSITSTVSSLPLSKNVATLPRSVNTHSNNSLTAKDTDHSGNNIAVQDIPRPRRSSARRSKMISIHPYFKSAIMQHFEAQSAAAEKGEGVITSDQPLSLMLADRYMNGHSTPRDIISIHPAFQRLIEESEEYSDFKRALQLQQGGGSTEGTAVDSHLPSGRYSTMGSTITSDSQRAVNDTLDMYTSMAFSSPLTTSTDLLDPIIPPIKVTSENIDSVLAPLMEDQDPHSIYTDLTIVAEGLSGDIYFAVDALVQAKVAIKIIPKDDDRSSLKLQTLKSEIMMMQHSNHRNIVECIGVYLTDDSIWIVMECMDGGSLADIIIDSPLSEPVAAYIAREILLGLEYLHTNHRIHRDIRSDTILLTLRGEVKISDLGYCIELPSAHATTNDLVGTPFWMAPEVISRQQYNTQADIWSFGVVLMEMLEQEYPYADLEVDAVFEQIKTNGLPQLHGLSSSALTAGLENSTTVNSTDDVYVSQPCLDVWSHATQMDPKVRWTATQLLNCEWLFAIATEGHIDSSSTIITTDIETTPIQRRSDAIQQLKELIFLSMLAETS